MKIAVEISGHLRDYEKGITALTQKIITPNADCRFHFFIHTWEDLCWRTSQKRNKTAAHKDNIEAKLRPDSFIIEDNRNWDTSKFLPHMRDSRDVKKGTKGEHILGMFHSINEANKLRKKYEAKNGDFDAVFRCRLDVGFTNVITLSSFSKDLQHTIFFPSSVRTLKNGFASGLAEEGKVTDVYAFSSPDNMDMYASIFDNLDTIVPECGFRPEAILNYWLEINKINCSQELGPWSLIEDWRLEE